MLPFVRGSEDELRGGSVVQKVVRSSDVAASIPRTRSAFIWTADFSVAIVK